MKRKILGLLVAVGIASVGLTTAAPTPVLAADSGSCMSGFLGFRPWYYGLCGSDGNIAEPEDEEAMKKFVWTIILNIVLDLLVAVGYASMILIIYGGYQFMTSQGDPGKATAGKKTLSSAIIGMVIALSASVLVNTVMVALNISTGGTLNKEDANRVGEQFTKVQIQNAFSWAYTVAGLVAVAFIIYGGIKYVTSQGDPGKTRSATQTIIYAVVGLVIVLLAAAITALVTSSVSSTTF